MSSVTLEELVEIIDNHDPEYLGYSLRELVLEHLPPHYKKFLDAMPERGPTTARKLADKSHVEINYAGTTLIKLEKLSLVRRNENYRTRTFIWRRA